MIALARLAATITTESLTDLIGLSLEGWFTHGLTVVPTPSIIVVTTNQYFVRKLIFGIPKQKSGSVEEINLMNARG